MVNSVAAEIMPSISHKIFNFLTDCTFHFSVLGASEITLTKCLAICLRFFFQGFRIESRNSAKSFHLAVHWKQSTVNPIMKYKEEFHALRIFELTELRKHKHYKHAI